MIARRESLSRYGFFSTIFPFSQMTIGVPYIFAVFRTLRGSRFIALATESKKRLSAADSFFFMNVPVPGLSQLAWAELQHYRKRAMRQPVGDRPYRGRPFPVDMVRW
jgi:hypothetical protein